MRFEILGPLQVRRGDEPVDLGPPKQRAVLAALLVSANRVVSLDRLIDELWGDEPPPAATASLQAYVANLRRVLEPDRPPRAPATVLVTRSPGYLLQVRDDELDAAGFGALVERGLRALAEDDAGSAHETLGEALALWRGPALQEFAGDGFADAEIARLAERRVAAREAHAEATLQIGRYGEAVSALERLVAEHPWRERLRELLMLALYRGGRQAEALEVLSRARDDLAEGLGIDPGPGLRDLHAAILRQDPSLTPLRPPPSPEVDGAAVPDVPPYGDGSDLVGRATPLAALRTAWDDVATGRGRLVLVSGEPGVGKTRLVQDLARHVRERGSTVVWGRCHDVEATPPFWPWRQVLRAMVDAIGLDTVLGAARGAGLALSLLVAELTADGAVDPAAPSAQARLLLDDGVARMLRDLATSRGPMTIALDDLHWADTPSLELMAYLAGELSDLPVLLVGTFRGEAAGQEHLATLLAAVAREPATERVRLAGLTPAEVGEVMARRAGTPVDDHLAAAMHERTDGNPFFVTELTGLLCSEGRLSDPADDWPVPDGVRDVLRRRLLRLPEQAVTLLRIGAVVGRSFDVEIVTRVSGLDEDRVLDAVEAALMTGLLVEPADTPGRPRFVHALVRETLYEDLSALRRARLHARIAEALPQLTSEPPVDALAHHLWHAGTGVAPETALAAARTAADAAGRALAFERAAAWWRRAVELTDRLPPGPERDGHTLDAGLPLANLLVQTRGSTPESSATWARVRDLGRATGRTAELTRAIWALAASAIVTGTPRTALAMGEELLALGHDTGDREQLLAGHDVLGSTLLFLGELERADEHAAETVRLADEIGRLSVFISQPAVSMRGWRSITRHLLGDVDGARALRAEALARAGEEDLFTRAYALTNAAQLAVHARDPDGTRQWAGEAIALCGEHGFAHFAAMGTIYDGWAAAMQGGAGAERIRTTVQAFRSRGARSLHHLYLGLCAEAELAEGRPDAARRCLDEASAEAEATGERFYVPALHRLAAELDAVHLVAR